MATHIKQVICSIITGAISLTLCGGTAVRADEDVGRAVYVEVCQRCHGQITERTSASPARVVPVVMLPPGPTLTGIIGRPVGSIAGFRYSNAMQALAATGAVWDIATLDRYLTNTQKFVRGSYMILKVAQPKRKQVLDYLDVVARYRR